MDSAPSRIAVIIPALDEAESIGLTLREIPRGLVSQVVVVDNGSQDRTADIARAAGACVVVEPHRGYGRACRAGLAELQPATTAVVFMDADRSHEPQDLESLVHVFREGHWDLALGSRVLGRPEPGSLTFLQRFGNWLSTQLIQRLWRVSFTDLGPLRVISLEALRRLDLRDNDFGWNVEMQAQAARLGLRVTEIPVHYRRRRFGKSKISGTLWGSARAGVKILWTIYRCWRRPLATNNPPQSPGSQAL
jgi:glycosyltransferase involved in cell wall biosynthesis